MRRVIGMIPNTITLLNLFCGCIAVMSAFNGELTKAFWFVIASCAFDFLDGFAARALNAYSPLGKELDSLADMVSFGVAPSAVLFSLGAGYVGFLVALFSALRLAKFNIDERQTSEFIGVPTPANAIMIISMGWITEQMNDSYLASLFTSPWILSLIIVIFTLLLVSEIRLFSLKIKGGLLSKSNLHITIFLVAALITLILFQIPALPFIIVGYVIYSLIFSALQRN